MDEVREWFADRAEQSSLRKEATRIGIGHTTLHNFLLGAAPHPRIWRTLRLYYQEHTGGGMEVEAPIEALAVLTSSLSGTIRDDAKRGIVEVLEDAHRTAGLELPRWFGTIRS